MCGLVRLVATWNCWMSYKNGYARLLVLHSLLLLNPYVYLNWLKWFHSPILEESLLVILIDDMVFLPPFTDVRRMPCQHFFPHTARLWNSRSKIYFLLTYDLNGFKFRINRLLLTVGFFEQILCMP